MTLTTEQQIGFVIIGCMIGMFMAFILYLLIRRLEDKKVRLSEITFQHTPPPPDKPEKPKWHESEIKSTLGPFCNAESNLDKCHVRIGANIYDVKLIQAEIAIDPNQYQPWMNIHPDYPIIQKMTQFMIDQRIADVKSKNIAEGQRTLSCELIILVQQQIKQQKS